MESKTDTVKVPTEPTPAPAPKKRGRPRKVKPPRTTPKRALNSYQAFFKEHYMTPECQSKSVRERVSWIASQWRKHKEDTKK